MTRERLLESLYIIATASTAVAALLVFALCAIALIGALR